MLQVQHQTNCICCSKAALHQWDSHALLCCEQEPPRGHPTAVGTGRKRYGSANPSRDLELGFSGAPGRDSSSSDADAGTQVVWPSNSIKYTLVKF